MATRGTLAILGVAFAALLLAPPTGAASRWSTALPVTVIASEYEFSPARLVFKQGVSYRLRVENHGKEQHEFTAPEFFAAAVVHNPGVLNADRTEIEIPPGMTREIFVLPRRAGHYELRCSDHDWAGMTGEITVE